MIKNNIKILFDTYYKPLCNFAFGYIKVNDIAEDIVQDTFVNVWENQEKFTDTISSKVFLYRTVKNKCLNWLKHLEVRAEKLNNPSFNDFDNDFFEKEMIKAETIRLIHEAVEKLPGNCKTIIELSLKGYKNEEIAQKLNLSINTIKTHKKNA